MLSLQALKDTLLRVLRIFIDVSGRNHRVPKVDGSTIVDRYMRIKKESLILPPRNRENLSAIRNKALFLTGDDCRSEDGWTHFAVDDLGYILLGKLVEAVS